MACILTPSHLEVGPAPNASHPRRSIRPVPVEEADRQEPPLADGPLAAEGFAGGADEGGFAPEGGRPEAADFDDLDPFADDEDDLDEPHAEGGPDGGPAPLRNLNAARVLILNASYEPLHVCSVKRAVALLMHEVAERVEDADRILRSPSQTFAVPSVIRLKRYVRRPGRQRVAFNRKNVFRRDDHACQYCGQRASDLTLDHVMPRSRGGPTSWENVVACCRHCNARKRDRTPDEARMALRRRPYAPRFMFSSAYGLLPSIDPIWHKYLPRSRD